MNTSEWIIITVFIIGFFFINSFVSKRFLYKIAPDKIEAIKLIGLSFLLGIFYAKAFDGGHGIGFQIALVAVTFLFIYRSYKWIKGLNAIKV